MIKILLLTFSLTCFGIAPQPYGGLISFQERAGHGVYEVTYERSLFLSQSEDEKPVYQFYTLYRAQTDKRVYPGKFRSFGPKFSERELKVIQHHRSLFAAMILKDIQYARDPYLFFLTYQMQPYKDGNPYSWLYTIPLDVISLPLTGALSFLRLAKDTYYRPQKILHALERLTTKSQVHSSTYINPQYFEAFYDLFSTGEGSRPWTKLLTSSPKNF